MDQEVHKYKKCFVPTCKNNSKNCPEKLFFRLPKNESLREKWALAVGRAKTEVSRNMFCCEDHFELCDDMENWLKYSISRDVKMHKYIKPSVVPHIFPEHDKMISSNGASSLKRKSDDSELVMHAQRKLLYRNSKSTEISSENQSPVYFILEGVPSSSLTQISADEDEFKVNSVETKNKGNQCNLFQKKVNQRSKGIQVGKELLFERANIPVQNQEEGKDNFSMNANTSPTKSVRSTVSTESSFTVNSCNTETTSSSNPEFLECIFKKVLEDRLKTTITLIERYPKTYTAIPEESFKHFTKNLAVVTGIPYVNILLVLKKIRVNDTFELLGHDFGMSKSSASKIFESCVPKMASHLKHFVIWSALNKIQALLPLPFRARHRSVQAIIDCLEIEDIHSSDSVIQSASYSQYKTANTLKFLISTTPDGLINFISKGCTGRINDNTIVDVSGYLGVLSLNATIMADRGFKHIQDLLSTKNCTLYRPSSVSDSAVLPKKAVKSSKRVSSLRIHIERAIRRIREFNYLTAHACIPRKMISITDYVIIIAAALVNTQGPLIAED